MEAPTTPLTCIHIGYHKCASTFLQEKLFPQIADTNEDLKRPLHGSAGERPQLLDWLTDPQFDSALIRDNAEEAAFFGKGERLVISQEELSGHLLGYDLTDPHLIARNLHRTFPEARILAVVRNQVDFLTSLYCYRVAIRGHETRTFDAFLDEDLPRGLEKQLRFHELLSLYRELFGDEKVLVLPMEQLIRDETEFLEQICSFLDIAEIPEMESGKTNRGSRQKMLIGLFRRTNIAFDAFLRLRARLDGKGAEAVDTRHSRLLAYFPLRNRYYSWQRRMSYAMARRFPRARKVDFAREIARHRLAERFADSNRTLRDSGLVDWDPADFGYPV